MKTLDFNNDLSYQNDAISAVADVFKGQEVSFNQFTIYNPKNQHQMQLSHDGSIQTPIGTANALRLDEEDVLENLNAVRVRNNLKPIAKLKKNSYNLAVEMETGTGKTFVYLKTIFELRKQYGFRKFVILVPSVAIREGVLSSLKMLESFFDYHYKSFPFHYFQYTSEKLSDLMEFARSDKIEIMVMTVQSLDSDNKVLHSANQKHLEQTGGVKPITVLSGCHPIVIVDEPQTTIGSTQRKDRVKDLTPLCTLQYSATHKDNKEVHKVYRLTAVDAYILKLVKQIEVASVIPKNDHNFAYTRLLETKSAKTKLTAKVELDLHNPKTGMIERKSVTVSPHQSLFEVSGHRSLYENMMVERIRCDGDNQSITVSGVEIAKGQALNAFDEDVLKRTQIRKTIEEHFEKEKRLNPLGIKVLSLFFIDKVANYRSWNGDEKVNGKFYQWFEEEYEAVRRQYEGNAAIVALDTPVEKVHQAYFAEDKGKYKDTRGDGEKDIKAYQSIMSDKMDLLSFSNPIRFIFSHSALREGWDNPNVFQICTLNESAKNNDRKRQEIGRGLRICVNQSGKRVYGFEYNTVTVMANQSYEDFARGLQTEIENDEGYLLGAIENLSFAALVIEGSDSQITPAQSKMLFDFCTQQTYISDEGKVTDTLKKALKDKSLALPQEMEPYRWDVTEYFKRVCGGLNIKEKSDHITYRQNKRIVTETPEFQELWNRIKAKTKYQVSYNTDALIRGCAKALSALHITGVEVEYTKAKIRQNTTGVETVLVDYDSGDATLLRSQYLPDIISTLQNATNLTRQTIVEILKESKTLDMFYLNPQRYMTDVAQIINDEMIKHIVDGISYKPIPGSEYYLCEVFPDIELSHEVDVLVKSDCSVYEYNYCDSETERQFANDLNSLENVVIYAKLPTKKFSVPTPVGGYSPDWVVVLKENEEHRLYFVVETKGSYDPNDRRGTENIKITCGSKRFTSPGLDQCGYMVATNRDGLLREQNKFTDDGRCTQVKLEKHSGTEN